MAIISFNENWTFYKAGESDYREVTLPHDAMLLENRSQTAAGGKNSAWFEGGDYYYKKSFRLEKAYEGSFIYLEFEGVYHNAEVFLNGEKIAFRPYGYTNFYVRIDDKINFDTENIIKVLAVNSDQPNSRWYSGAGIYRPVSLHILPKNHIELNGIKISTQSIATPQIKLSIETSCGGDVFVEILDGNDIIKQLKAVTNGKFEANIDLENAELWSCDNPKLYTCRVAFDEDIQEQVFGIRSVNCDADNGFCLNGNRIILRGACIHHDNGLLGAVAHPYSEYRKIKILKESGYNAIRSSHNPCSKAMLDACDKLGMMVLDEYVDMWYIHKDQYDYANYFKDWWKQDLKDMVDKDYNHPSVIMYSIGNEVAETGQKSGIELTERMTQYLHSLDQNRPVTCGINMFFNYLHSLGFGVYSDKKAQKAAKTSKKKKAVGSEFFNDLAGRLGDKVMKIGAWLPGSNKKSKHAFANLDVAGYNYGILRYKKDMRKFPKRIILGTETFCKDAYKFWEIAKKNNAVIGDFVWAGMDYMGEVAVGSWVYADHAPDFSGGVGWITAGSGRIDITGKPLGEMAYSRVAFELDSIRMAVIPADNYKKPHSPSAWKMTTAIESWTYEGCEGNKTVVEVYSRAYQTALFLNGKKLGTKRLGKDCRLKFKVRYAPGILTAVGYDKAGNELYSTSLKTAGSDTMLQARAEEATINKDGLCYVRFCFTDSNGILKPLKRSKIFVKVDNGTLLGLGHACPYNSDGYLNDFTDTYYGEALAIIRPNGEGNIAINAQSHFGKAQTIVKVVD